MQEAADGSRTTGWANKGWQHGREAHFRGKMERKSERERETQGEREKIERKSKRNKGRSQ